MQAKKKVLEDKFTLGSSSSVYDEAARRVDLQTLPKKELINILGQKRSVLDEAGLIDKIIAKEKVGKSSPIDLNPIKTQLGNVDYDIQKIVKMLKGAHEEYKELESDFRGQEATDEENRLTTI